MPRRPLWLALLLPALLLLACASADSDPDPERDADDDAEQNQPEPEPIVCDSFYNDTLGKGDLNADLAGLADYTEYSSSDVSFTFKDTGQLDGRWMLMINAREWCLPGISKSDLLLSCRLLPEDLETLPLTAQFGANWISGKNCCRVTFADSRAVFNKNPDGEITLKTYQTDTGVSGTFEAGLTESTDPDSTISFTNGAFEAIPDA